MTLFVLSEQMNISHFIRNKDKSAKLLKQFRTVQAIRKKS